MYQNDGSRGDLAPLQGLFLFGYLGEVAVVCSGMRLRRNLPPAELTAEIRSTPLIQQPERK